MEKLENVVYFIVDHGELDYIKVAFQNSVKRSKEEGFVSLKLVPIGFIGFKITLICTKSNKTSGIFFDRLYRNRESHTIKCKMVGGETLDLKVVLSKKDRERLLNKFRKES